MLYQIDEEYLDEFINLKEEEINSEIVEYLSNMRDYTVDAATRKLLYEYIVKLSGKYKICRGCLNELTPIVTKEPHPELDGYWYEEFVDGYKCDNCGNRYDY